MKNFSFENSEGDFIEKLGLVTGSEVTLYKHKINADAQSGLRSGVVSYSQISSW